MNAYSISIMLTTPFVMVMLTLVVYFNGDGDFSPDVVFTAVSLLLIIRFPLMMLPMAIASWVQGKVRGWVDCGFSSSPGSRQLELRQSPGDGLLVVLVWFFLGMSVSSAAGDCPAAVVGEEGQQF